MALTGASVILCTSRVTATLFKSHTAVMRDLSRRCLAGVTVSVMLASTPVHAQTEPLRPEVGKPLQAAQEMIKSQRFKEALAKVRDADAVGNKNAYESFMVERMRLAAASGAGDADTAAKSFEAISASPRVSAGDKLKMIESLAGSFYRSHDYAKSIVWANRYFKEGGTDPSIRTLLIQSQYLGGDYAGAARELTVEIQNAEKSGATPSEERIKLLMNAALKMNDTGTYVLAVEKLVTYYPKKEYWVDLLSRLQRKSDFSGRLALDAYRLSLATGSMTSASDYMESAQLAAQAGFPAEGKQIVDKGFAANVLGVGPEADRHKRLRDLMVKRTTEDAATHANEEAQAAQAREGDALVNVGYEAVLGGQAAKGIEQMQAGIAKGNLRHPDDAKLHLGVAQVIANQPAKALATFKTVGGKDGTADLARLWSLYLRRKA